MSLVNYTRCSQACSSHATLLLLVVDQYVNPESLRGEWRIPHGIMSLPLIWFVIWICHGPFEFYQVSVLWVHFKKKIYLFFDCSGYSLLHLGFLYLLQVRAGLRYGARTSHCGGFCCCEAWFLKHRLSSCGMDLVALWHVGSSWTRDWTHVPFIDRQILKH